MDNRDRDDTEGTRPGDGSAGPLDPTVSFHGEPTIGAFDARALDTKLEAGRRFGRYRLLRPLGTGGSAQVWEAESLDDQRRVALKVLAPRGRPTPQSLERFEQEGRLAAQLSHPHSVYVFGAEEIEGFPTIAMEVMPGGSLQEVLDREGPMPHERAVEATLEVIRALEGAQEIGILHRDVKPSNCFVDEAGRVRLGDFGISKSLEFDGGLTATGTFLGTPAYAAPEQIRGEPADFRSDMYSLGATLYALLCGKAPFLARNAGALVSSILTEPPAPLESHGVNVPNGLRRVVDRLLSKDPARRYASYAALRKALLPYGPRALRPTTLGRRAAAYLVDTLIVDLFSISGAALMGFELFQTPVPKHYVALGHAIVLVYYGLTEGLGGASLGKRLFRLRVTQEDGSPVGLARGFGRIAALVAFSLPFYIVEVDGKKPLYWLALTIALIPLTTMRRRNGFAGIHELVSGTRIMVSEPKSTSSRESLASIGFSIEGAPSRLGRLGPYEVQRCLAQTERASLYLARDTRLRRDVWIRAVPAEASGGERPDHPERQTRLRWLQSGVEAELSWSAFEAPTGAPLADIARARGGLAWDELRPLLLDLIQEIEAGLRANDLPRRLSTDRLWLDRFDRLRLLEFAVPGRGKEDGVGREEWVLFLRKTIALALGDEREATEEVPRVLLPENGRRIIERLWSPDLGIDQLAAVGVQIGASLREPGRVTRLRRLGPPLFASVVPAAIALSVVAGIGVVLWSESRPWGPDLRRLDSKFRHMDGCRAEGNVERVESAERLLASAYLQYREDSARWMRHFDDQELVRLEGFARDHPAVTLEEIERARVVLAGTVFDLERNRMPRKILLGGFGAFLFLLGIEALPALLICLLIGRPVTFHLLGIAVRDAEGQPVGRGRILIRTLIAWSPALLFVIYALTEAVAVEPGRNLAFRLGVIIGTSSSTGGIIVLVALVACVVFGVALVTMLRRPAASLADRLARTRLVPD